MLADGCVGEDFETGEEVYADPAGGEAGVYGLVAAFDEPDADGLLGVVDDECFACWLTVGWGFGGDEDSDVGETYLKDAGGNFGVKPRSSLRARRAASIALSRMLLSSKRFLATVESALMVCSHEGERRLIWSLSFMVCLLVE